MSNAPISHIEESLKLTADSIIDLYELRTKGNAIVRFWNGPTRTWNMMTFEGVACQLTGESQSSESQYARPLLTVVNPDNSFGLFAAQGVFDLAIVTRYRVLQQDFINNNPIYQPLSLIHI